MRRNTINMCTNSARILCHSRAAIIDRTRTCKTGWHRASSPLLEKAPVNMPLTLTARRIAIEPRWRPAGHFSCRQLPPHTRRWLLDDSSLTARLSHSGRGAFAVQRLYQGWQVPLPSERRLLALPARRQALVREVCLTLDGQAVVFARSVFPLSSLSGGLAHLRRLRNSSLGAILFRHPGMRRSPFEISDLAGDAPYIPRQLRQRPDAWARRSRFDLDGKSLLVAEVFLSPFVPWTSPLSVHRSQRGKVSAAITPTTQ